MRMGRIEFGLIQTPDKNWTLENRSFESRTIKWFFRQFGYRTNYGMYTGSCNCYFIDVGPLFLTVLSKHCIKKS